MTTSRRHRCALGGNDNVTGGEGNDLVVGGRGDDALAGDGGNDLIFDNADVISDATVDAPNGSCETVGRQAPRTADANAVWENLQQRAADLLAKLRGNR